MEDITPKLLQKIKEEFSKTFEANKKIAGLRRKLKEGKATYKEAQKFAEETGEVLAGVFRKNISSNTLPNGRLYYNIANRIIPEMLKGNFELASGFAVGVQEIINKNENIGIRAISPEINQDKINGIVDIVSGKEVYDDIAYMLGEPIVNFTQSVVDDAVRANAEFQFGAGLSPKIERTVAGNCCEWCAEKAGVYDYEDVRDTGNPVFRRHKYCRCLVEYKSGSGKRQNVHSKKWLKSEDSDIIKERKTVGLQPDSDIVIKKIKQEIAGQKIERVTERQDIHRKGTKLYEERKKRLEEKGEYGPSQITISNDEILELVKEYSGEGIVKYNRKGEWNHQETIVSNDKIVGIVVNNRNGKSAETPVFKIHYANDGIHIVPDYPSKRK